MKRVLMIAYFFPPLGGGGVQRTLSFARELPRWGWRPGVVCAGEDACYWARDEQLLELIPPDAEIHRVAEGRYGAGVHGLRRLLPGPLRAVFDALTQVPDRAASWIPAAWGRARWLAQSGAWRVLYTTGGPFSDHLIGWALKREFGLPWVADFRDPWSRNPLLPVPTPLHRLLYRRLEALVHRDAECILANTPTLEREFAADFPWAAGKTIVLPNGYSEADFVGLNLGPLSVSGPITIAYTGSFYPGYDGSELFRLLAGVFERAPELKLRVRIDLLGKTDSAAAIARAGLSGIVRELGYVSHRRALEALSGAHAALLIAPKEELRVPQKLYVYLRIGRPILAIGPRAEAVEILEASGGCFCAINPAEPGAGPALQAWLTRLVRGELAPVAPKAEVVERYERTGLVRRLAQVFDGLARIDLR